MDASTRHPPTHRRSTARSGSLRVAIVWLLLAIGAAMPARAQVAGRVVDADGAPLAGVRLTLERADAAPRAVVTASDGAFRFDSAASARATTLRAHRIGYTPVERAVRPGETDVLLRMTAVPLALEGLAASARRHRCPAPDDARARQLWSEAAARYADVTGTRGWELIGWQAEQTREADDLHRIDEAALRPLRARPGPTATRDVDPMIDSAGYARPLPYRDPGYRALETPYFAWRYVALHGTHAYHFASPVFAAGHTFQLLGDDGAERWIGFCPVRRDRPHVSGTLRIAEGALHSAEWRWHVPRADERAGGQVVFDTAWVAGEARPHLVAGRGVFWRRVAGTPRYLHVTTVAAARVISTDGAPPVDRPTWSEAVGSRPQEAP